MSGKSSMILHMTAITLYTSIYHALMNGVSNANRRDALSFD
jgi:hypothetical protein